MDVESVVTTALDFVLKKCLDIFMGLLIDSFTAKVYTWKTFSLQKTG